MAAIRNLSHFYMHESCGQCTPCREGLPWVYDMMCRLEKGQLSEREIEILVGICQGLSTQEIADKLFISKRTVDKHRANILEKSGCKNTASLVVYAIKNHLVQV